MSSNNSRNLTPSGVCSPTQPNSFPPHVPLVQRQFDCQDQVPRKSENTKEVGYFCEWDNGEQLGPNILCHLTIGGQTTIHRLRDGKRLFQPAPPGEYEAGLLQDVDTEKKLNEARQQLQKALDAIIEHEKEEAAALKKIQDGQHTAVRKMHLFFAMTRGFTNSGVEFIKTTKETYDLLNPGTTLLNLLAAAWTTKRDDGTSWIESFLENYSNEQKRELAEVLGFHPNDISRKQIAEAYETACFIYDDTDSRKILIQFAATYIEVQNIQEKMEFTGSVLFEIVLNILLAALTGGVGNAARVAVSAPLLKLLKPLKEALENLTKWIVNHTVKSGSHVRGATGTEAVPVTLRRPREIIPDEMPLPPKGERQIPASSSLAREGLRNNLANQAGIPRSMDTIWGSSAEQLAQSFQMDGATVARAPTKKYSSGNAQVFKISDSPTGITEIQHSPSTTKSDVKSTHLGEYYKITYDDGSKIKIVDPVEYKPTFSSEKPEPIYDRNTTYLNPKGEEVKFDPSSNKWILK